MVGKVYRAHHFSFLPARTGGQIRHCPPLYV
jgi:hypothetical protein